MMLNMPLNCFENSFEIESESNFPVSLAIQSQGLYRIYGYIGRLIACPKSNRIFLENKWIFAMVVLNCYRVIGPSDINLSF